MSSDDVADDPKTTSIGAGRIRLVSSVLATTADVTVSLLSIDDDDDDDDDDDADDAGSITVDDADAVSTHIDAGANDGADVVDKRDRSKKDGIESSAKFVVAAGATAEVDIDAGGGGPRSQTHSPSLRDVYSSGAIETYGSLSRLMRCTNAWRRIGFMIGDCERAIEGGWIERGAGSLYRIRIRNLIRSQRVRGARCLKTSGT